MTDPGPDPCPGLFEVIDSTRSMRRLKTDPVPMEMIWRVLEAGSKAANGQNTQPWSFLVLTEPDAKRFVQEHYLAVFEKNFGVRRPLVEDRSAAARSMRAALHLADHMHEAPVLLFVCGRRDWPFAVAAEHRVGLAPPSYGSTYPCVQNILLACRGLGLGATLTTLHQLYDRDLHERFDIPDDYGIVAMIPIGFPLGNFGPVRRQPVREVTHFEKWG